MNSFLLIDTTEHNKARVELWQDKMVGRVTKIVNRTLSERLIFIIESFLKQHKTKLTELSGIAVRVGEGSFTGIRTGAATGNALGYSLKIPVIALKIGEEVSQLKFPKIWSLRAQALPVYGKPPTITKTKK